MPGIVGFIRKSIEDEKAKGILHKMQELITHKDFYAKDVLFCDEYICATRSHTNIIQKQPQPYYDSGIYIWLNGEFYNQKEISSKYTHLQDLNILLDLYRVNDDFSFLKQIDGCYSAVIYDTHKQKAHLITDRYGLSFIYWSIQNGRLFWGSELKAMLAFPDFSPKIDRQSVEDFFGIGQLLEDRTWFEGVELLSPGTVLTWNIKENSMSKHRYWQWSDIKPYRGKIDCDEIVEEVGRLFKIAVENRCRKDERIGLTLSGGLDSRAILAALSERGDPVSAVTFGKKGCDDVRIASMAVKAKKANHHIVEIDKDNWLMGRTNGVWLTDGQMNLMHMHAVIARELLSSLFDVVLQGEGAAILSGVYFDGKEDVYHKFDNRGRRFINVGNVMGQAILVPRRPYLDNNFFSFAASLPEDIRKDFKLYKKFLLKKYPDYFMKIPYASFEIPISWPNFMRYAVKAKNRVRKNISRIGFKFPDSWMYTDYANWIREELAKSFFEKVLKNPAALYPEYIERDKVKKELESHLIGNDYADNLCRYLTFEIWLQQIYKGNYRL